MYIQNIHSDLLLQAAVFWYCAIVRHSQRVLPTERVDQKRRPLIWPGTLTLLHLEEKSSSTLFTETVASVFIK